METDTGWTVRFAKEVALSSAEDVAAWEDYAESEFSMPIDFTLGVAKELENHDTNMRALVFAPTKVLKESKLRAEMKRATEALSGRALLVLSFFKVTGTPSLWIATLGRGTNGKLNVVPYLGAAAVEAHAGKPVCCCHHSPLLQSFGGTELFVGLVGELVLTIGGCLEGGRRPAQRTDGRRGPAPSPAPLVHASRWLTMRGCSRADDGAGDEARNP